MLRATVYSTFDPPGDALQRITRTVLMLDVDHPDDFRSRASAALGMLFDTGAVLEFGPIGPPWDYARLVPRSPRV